MTTDDRLLIDKEYKIITSQWTYEMINDLAFELSTFLMDHDLKI